MVMIQSRDTEIYDTQLILEYGCCIYCQHTLFLQSHLLSIMLLGISNDITYTL